MAKKKTKTSALDEVISNSVNSQWCIVNTENKFDFDTNTYNISESIKQYLVFNKPQIGKDGKLNDWTNESSMTQVLVVDTGQELRFFDENLVEVQSEYVKIV